MNYYHHNDTIIALSTAPGLAAIALVRLSGKDALEMLNKYFQGKDLNRASGQTLHFGNLVEHGEIIDEVVVGLYKNPKSYTGQDLVEISCHGSPFIIQTIIRLFIDEGARLANPGEFTQRAFLAGKIDLSQAEAVADLISSGSAAAHKLAMKQLKGAISKEISSLREQLLRFAALIELELDFSTEDVEFANRKELVELIHEIKEKIEPLIASFKIGNAVKDGFPVAIIGMPNVGKSTLLNTLLQEDKAIVTEFAGTTRDIIEDEMIINGLNFRFIDTAGIRETTDIVESIGIERSRKAIQDAELVLFVYDGEEDRKAFNDLLNEIESENKTWIAVRNKSDLSHHAILENEVQISAKLQHGIEQLKKLIWQKAGGEAIDSNAVLLTNHRHYEALVHTNHYLTIILNGLHSGISGDLLALDIRSALDYLGSVTGHVSSDEVLGAIFSKFCIGK